MDALVQQKFVALNFRTILYVMQKMMDDAVDS
jgi:hypothetical protein